jgi:hypothetical protein
LYVPRIEGTATDDPWSPDGTKIVFFSIREFRHDLYVMNVDASGQALIDNGADDDSFPDRKVRLRSLRRFRRSSPPPGDQRVGARARLR